MEYVNTKQKVATPTMIVKSNMSKFYIKPSVRKQLNFIQEVISRASFIIKNLIVMIFSNNSCTRERINKLSGYRIN